jgi:hypothetical protein
MLNDFCVFVFLSCLLIGYFVGLDVWCVISLLFFFFSSLFWARPVGRAWFSLVFLYICCIFVG